jgi:hypothetical protein
MRKVFANRVLDLYSGMTVIRLIAILLLTSLVSGQEFSSPKIGQSNTPKPKLPVVDYNACPGKGVTVPNVEISEDYRMYRSWQGNGKSVARLKAGEKVTVLGGVNVIREPDRAVIKYVDTYMDSSLLKVGDIVFGYGIEAGGGDVFWANGLWFDVGDESVAEHGLCGFHPALAKADAISISSRVVDVSGGCTSKPVGVSRVGSLLRSSTVTSIGWQTSTPYVITGRIKNRVSKLPAFLPTVAISP